MHRVPPKSLQTVWMGLFKRVFWWHYFLTPVEFCWQVTTSHNWSSPIAAGARIRNDISIYQCDGSHTHSHRKRFYMVSNLPESWQQSESEWLQRPGAFLQRLENKRETWFRGWTQSLQARYWSPWALELSTNYYPSSKKNPITNKKNTTHFVHQKAAALML